MDFYKIEDLEIGMSDYIQKTVTEADIVLFSGISGDFNPVHIDEEYAKKTIFKTRIAHGILSAGFISAALSTKLPGPGCIYMAQSLKFKAPVRINDTVRTTVTITDVNIKRKIVKLETICSVGDTKVIIGESTMMMP
ncbi:MAG: (R)-hydratase [Cycloclasticus sp. symbiont of Bathymodiolus heckerae]|nr:MAG: (R)-hydratase [Cycloclasticus sp. symbiont of Bathymodiolus heckerae]